jgi:hypothetical protein
VSGHGPIVQGHVRECKLWPVLTHHRPLFVALSRRSGWLRRRHCPRSSRRPRCSAAR